jgi:hypothetical protein
MTLSVGTFVGASKLNYQSLTCMAKNEFLAPVLKIEPKNGLN